MLESLGLENVGPASSMELEFAPRMNLLTGDNGLGKSFLLDVAWWALTMRWPWEVNRYMTTGYPARPRDEKKPSAIRFRGRGRTESVRHQADYSRRDEAWVGHSGESYDPWAIAGWPCDPPGLVIYAHADGSFSVWDPARNYGRRQDYIDMQERQSAYVFTEPEVWDGLWSYVDDGAPPLCNGLLYDWSTWIRAKDNRNASLMASVLRILAPEQGREGVIESGSPKRLSIDDARDIPSINTSYTGPVPILHASSGIRRMCALAYMLIWTWSEHRSAAEMRCETTSQRIIMLFDEVESHLHPRWQRSILTSLLNIGNELQEDIELQLVVTTHSPLILASAEAWFDPERDAWFDLDLEGDPPQVQLYRRSYTPRGTAGAWLTSEAFDLATDRGSVEAERAILRARELLRQPEPPLDEVMQVHVALRAVLPDVDRFWVRWNAFVERRGGTP